MSKKHFFIAAAFLAGVSSSLFAPRVALAIELPPAALNFEVNENGRRVEYEITPDQLYLRTPGQEDRIVQTVGALETTAKGATLTGNNAAEADLVVYPKGADRTEANRRTLTRRITVRLAPGTDGQAVARKFGLETKGELPYAPGFYVFTTAGAAQTPGLARTLRGEPGVISAEPILGRKLRPKFFPNDPLFKQQWTLRNTGQNGATQGVDVHVANVWDNYRGKGVNIAIVDDGLQYTHPDLAANCNTALQYDYRDNDPDPAPNTTGQNDSHGTAVGGVAAAVGNNGIGGAGSGYEATLIGIRLIGGSSGDDQEAAALSHSNSVVHISNNSWGPDDDGQQKGGTGPLAKAALENGVRNGRSGLGTIYMWAAGNGGLEKDNANYDGYNSSIYTISVGALNDLGDKADYSEPGACLLITTPAGAETSGRPQGTTTTDLTGDSGYNNAESNPGPVSPDELDDKDYTQGFNGTSSATPLASGVVSLVLQANPRLGWRDVQEILIRTAAKTTPNDPDWISNGAGLHFNHKFGAGLLDAEAAVNAALTWKNLPAQTSVQSVQENLALPIPDHDAAGLVRTFDLGSSNLRVEAVTVGVDITHPFRGDLIIELTSPSGTVSRLYEVHDDKNADLSHAMKSVFNWGENSKGVWKVKVADGRAQNVGALKSLTLTVYGTESSVLPANLPPTIDLIPTKTVKAGEILSFIVKATDPDVPAQSLRFSLESGPEGAAIDPNSGRFTWTPPVLTIGKPNLFRVTVTDDGTPALSSTTAFSVNVEAASPAEAPKLVITSLAAGLFRFSIQGEAGADYTIQTSTDLQTWNPLLKTNAPAATFEFSDTLRSERARFYRVVTGI